MLKQRIITALVLLGLLIPALFHSDPFWVALAGMLFISAASWEWGRLNQIGSFLALGMALFCVAMCGLFWQYQLMTYLDRFFWLMVGCLWVLMGTFLLAGGVYKWSTIALPVRIIGGMVLLWFTWAALIISKNLSTEFLMSVLLLVWMADVAAYFSGKAFGRHKLAPNISPGKTWEGVGGAICGVFLLAFVWLTAVDHFGWTSHSIFEKLAQHSWLLLILGLVFLVMMSVVGDLLESLVKRSVGAKDSSQLLPGHGGILDRIDALLPTLPIAVMLALI
jgi:phosphatidate cytidylyltransferase